MEMSNYVESSNQRETSLQLSDRFYQDCLNALGSKGEDAAMVLNDRGEVIFCNLQGAKILNRSPDIITGKHISEMVLNTRLNALTPGSNVAYASFAGRRNQWREYSVLESNGESYPVELLMDVLVVDLQYLILLWARKSVKRAHLVGVPQMEGYLSDNRTSNHGAVSTAGRGSGLQVAR